MIVHSGGVHGRPHFRGAVPDIHKTAHRPDDTVGRTVDNVIWDQSTQHINAENLPNPPLWKLAQRTAGFSRAPPRPPLAPGPPPSTPPAPGPGRGGTSSAPSQVCMTPPQRRRPARPSIVSPCCRNCVARSLASFQSDQRDQCGASPTHLEDLLIPPSKPPPFSSDDRYQETWLSPQRRSAAPRVIPSCLPPTVSSRRSAVPNGRRGRGGGPTAALAVPPDAPHAPPPPRPLPVRPAADLRSPPESFFFKLIWSVQSALKINLQFPAPPRLFADRVRWNSLWCCPRGSVPDLLLRLYLHARMIRTPSPTAFSF